MGADCKSLGSSRILTHGNLLYTVSSYCFEFYKLNCLNICKSMYPLTKQRLVFIIFRHTKDQVHYKPRWVIEEIGRISWWTSFLFQYHHLALIQGPFAMQILTQLYIQQRRQPLILSLLDSPWRLFCFYFSNNRDFYITNSSRHKLKLTFSKTEKV